MQVLVPRAHIGPMGSEPHAGGERTAALARGWAWHSWNGGVDHTGDAAPHPTFFNELQNCSVAMGRIRRAVADGRTSDAALIYLPPAPHSFRDAAVRAAQLAFDLQFDGTVAAFSWPALALNEKPPKPKKAKPGAGAPTPAPPLTVQQRADSSAGALAAFVSSLATVHPALHHIHVVAEGDGARVLQTAANTLLTGKGQTGKRTVPFDEIVLMAPVLSADLPPVWSLAERATVYTPDADFARAIRPAAGDKTEIVTVDGEALRALARQRLVDSPAAPLLADMRRLLRCHNAADTTSSAAARLADGLLLAPSTAPDAPPPVYAINPKAGDRLFPTK
jgi:hypothetical protein